MLPALQQWGVSVRGESCASDSGRITRVFISMSRCRGTLSITPKDRRSVTKICFVTSIHLDERKQSYREVYQHVCLPLPWSATAASLFRRQIMYASYLLWSNCIWKHNDESSCAWNRTLQHGTMSFCHNTFLKKRTTWCAVPCARKLIGFTPV